MDFSKNIEGYFTPSAWRLLSEYEKRRYENLQANYEVLKATGITPRLPQFMTRNNHKNQRSQMKGNVPKGLIPVNKGQRTKLKLFAVPKKPKSVKEPFEIGENSGVSQNTLIPSKRVSVTTKISIRRVTRVQFSQIALSSTDNALRFLETIVGSSVEEYTLEVKRRDIVEESKTRYPKRSIKTKSYKEEDVSSDDDFLHCDDCDDDYKGPCPVHGPMILFCDTKVAKDDPESAKKSLPKIFSISRSLLPKAGLGIWTEVPLPKGSVFGPYKGDTLPPGIARHQARESGYAWQVRKGSGVHHYVEGADKSKSNWMRFVNCAPAEERQNLVAFQLRKEVYYRTYKDVLPFTELLVWYGDSYARDLDIDLAEETHIPREISGYACGECQSLFSSSAALKAHRHPHMQSDRRHECTECPYSTDHTANLRRHLLTHGGERPHACPHCHKGFVQKEHLQRHLLVHTGEKPFSCSVCGRGFNQLCNMRGHERSHTDERRNRCPTCGKDFTHASHLKRHQLTHTLQRPHRCPQCDYRAARASHLRNHVMTAHTRKFKHACSLCGKGFLSPGELTKHHEKKHKEAEQQK